jgi:hypothetical protein
MVPDETYLEIFSYLDETDLVYAMKVSKKWHQLINNLNILYISDIFSKTLSFGKLILNCCEYNHLLSFDKAINKLNTIFPQINYADLWNKCIYITCKKGYFALFKRLHVFAIYDHNALIKLAKNNNHQKIVDYLSSQVDQNSKYM